MRSLAMIEKGGILVITLDDIAGLNEGQGATLRQQLYPILGSRVSPQVIFDLTAIDYLSSSGIALLIGSKRRIETAQGRLVLLGLQPEVYELFAVMKLVNLFEIADNEAAALQLFPPHSSI